MSDDQAVQHSDDGISEGAYGAYMQLQPRCNAGSEHIGCLIGKRFSGKMYLGQCIAWLPAGSAENHYGILVGQDEYKVIFHDNDVHLLSHVDLLECKKNVKSSLTTARNLKALKGYVEVWQQTYDRVVEQAVAECSGKVDNQQQEAQFFPATIREVKGDGFFFVSWDDGYGLDRTKCAFELQRPQFREGKVWACTILLYSSIRFSSLLLTFFLCEPDMPWWSREGPEVAKRSCFSAAACSRSRTHGEDSQGWLSAATWQEGGTGCHGAGRCRKS